MQRYPRLLFTLLICLICYLVAGCTAPAGMQAATDGANLVTPVPENTTPLLSSGHESGQPSSGIGSLRIFTERGISFKYPAEYSVTASEQRKDQALTISQGAWDYSYYDPLADIFLSAFENPNQTKRLDVYYGGQGITSDGYYNHMLNQVANAKNLYELNGYYNFTYARVTKTFVSDGVNAIVLDSKILNDTAPLVPFHPPKEGGKVVMYVIITGRDDYVLRFSYDDYRTADSDAPIRTEVINSIDLSK